MMPVDNYDPNELYYNKIPIDEKAPRHIFISPMQKDESIRVDIEIDHTYEGAIIKLKEHATRLVKSIYREYYYDIEFFQWSIYVKQLKNEYGNYEKHTYLSFEFSVNVKEPYTNNGYSGLSEEDRKRYAELEKEYNPPSDELLKHYETL